ncbi:Pyridoxal phosphate-dependent decarboxylase [Kalmanozyma brasiliensis GHG001]|uniref:sphinganine-1-phosphate aldolase n=1 Tax=Kalmanozyma brasiliensis (strain GHG001) TaxID=1365824 RepID=V5F043_KALBG|nr:Pyridoxal phosphate-dependent decarboxylase [Kalmanozyma brasiliensis GHG001]EST08539.1 Pyridoxal phosphate-dependent decarboxylase [Kalmanozyma brasiliensis GHG001]
MAARTPAREAAAAKIKDISTLATSARASASDDRLLITALRTLATFDNAKNAVFFLVLYRYTTRLLRHLKVYGISESLFQIYRSVSARAFALLLKTPAAKRKVARELNAAMKEVEEKIVPRPSHLEVNRSLPQLGKESEWIRGEMGKLQTMEAGVDAKVVESDWKERDGQSVWKGGKVSGAVYHGGDDLSELLADSIRQFLVSNPLHPDVFPGVRKMEAEIVAMVLAMYNAPPGAAGATSSGGTESILLSCLAMREWARATKGIKEPELIVSVSAHAAFDKAGQYFGIKIHHIPVDPVTRKVLVGRVARAINSNTIGLVGSAPNFPDGAIDDIPHLAKLARAHKILLHVDCCLGSFLVPFLSKAGFESEPFDFRVEGVTSISCDTHKYGFGPKGLSTILYRSAELRRFQYYVKTDWPGGVYATPTLSGSRPGSLIAGTWAAMMHLGQSGYTQSCRDIVGATKEIVTRIEREIPELYVLGKPLVSVIAFASAADNSVSIYDVGDSMSKKGWHMNGLSGDTPAIHIAVTRLTIPVVDEFVKDLKESVQTARASFSGKKGSMATLYGLGSGVSATAIVGELASRFIDTLYLL